MTTPHEWFVENRLEYATRTLEPEDERTFEAHLAGCEECQVEVAGSRAISAGCRWRSTPVAPRPGLRRRIAERVLGEKPRPSSRAIPRGRAGGARGVGAAGGREDGSRDQCAGRPVSSRSWRAQRAAIAALMDTLSIMREAGRVLQASVDVNGTRGGLLIFADEATHRWNVVVHGLPPAPPGYRYQFWFICDDGMVRGNEVQASTSRPTMFTTGMPQPQSCPAVKGAAADRGADGG